MVQNCDGYWDKCINSLKNKQNLLWRSGFVVIFLDNPITNFSKEFSLKTTNKDFKVSDTYSIGITFMLGSSSYSV